MIHSEEAHTWRTSSSKEWPQCWNLHPRTFLGTVRSGTHWWHRQCAHTRTVPNLLSKDSLSPHEHRTNLHNNQTHTVLNNSCKPFSTFPFPKCHDRIFPVHLFFRNIVKPPSLLPSSHFKLRRSYTGRPPLQSWGRKTSTKRFSSLPKRHRQI